jgi:uncharacterized coiled-coil protein SlyX
VAKLFEFLTRERRLWEQERRIRELSAELDELREQNERMRTAMRRCITCEYRIESVARRNGEA